MQASIILQSHGCFSLQMDAEATRAICASIVFAARFHPGIAPLTSIAEKCLDAETDSSEGATTPCR